MIEKRIHDRCTFRSVGEDTRRVEGYALVFDSLSRDLGGVVETIDPHALDGVLENSDVKCWLNHDPSRGALARCRGENMEQSPVGNSMELEVDEVGLRYAFDAPHTAIGDELLEGLRRGDISQSSFAFTVAEDKWERLNDGMAKRTILKFDRLFDVSPVYDPAYMATSVELDRRGLDAMEAEEREAKRKEDEAKAEELAKYYDELEQLIG